MVLGRMVGSAFAVEEIIFQPVGETVGLLQVATVPEVDKGLMEVRNTFLRETGSQPPANPEIFQENFWAQFPTLFSLPTGSREQRYFSLKYLA